ncbi:helix-turn-helix domain-containing protein [Aquipluma nitroreducens]|uniref:hypothetical protein n=1 Tax=Aquipluma nitroreducens TaxID=2010828 RepID=UPI00296F7889|nr:hypothetical protein [Aquipluma nitroreducens]
MRLKFDKIRRNPTHFFILTGFTIQEFNELALEFRGQWEQHSSHFTLKGKTRQRKALRRKTNVLPGYQDKLLFILVYLESFPSQELQATAFSMTQPQANSWIHLLCNILHKTLEKINKISDLENKKVEQLLMDCQHVLSKKK